MTYINYELCYSICNGYELFEHNWSEKDKIHLENKVGKEYINLLNNMDKLSKEFDKIAINISDKMKKGLNKFDPNKIYKLFNFENIGLNTMTSSLIEKSFMKNFVFYIQRIGMLVKFTNDIEKDLEVIKKEKTNNTKKIKKILENYHFNNVNELEEELECRLEMRNRHIKEEEDNIYSALISILGNIQNDIYNSVHFYFNERMVLPSDTNTFLGRAMEDLSRRIMEKSNYLEIPRHQVNYEYLKGNDIIIDSPEELREERVISYDTLNIKDFCSININYFLDNKIYLKTCENCGKFFITESRSDEKYCDNKLPNGLTCKQYAPTFKYYNDEFNMECKKLNNRYNRKITYCNLLQEKEKLKKEKEEFLKERKDMITLLRKGKKNNNDLMEWIKKKVHEYEKIHGKKVRISKNKK